MADEIRVQISLSAVKGNFKYQNTATAFLATMANSPRGVTPGQVRVTHDGVDVSLSGVARPGWSIWRNIEDGTTNYIQIGVWNPDQSEFYPVLRLYPGEHAALPLDPEINEEYAGTGSGTTGQLNTLRVKSQSDYANLEVYVLER